MTERADVPCNGCTLCCRHAFILLVPGEDAIETFEHVVEHTPKGDPVYRLKHREDGACVYLGPDGCTIHDRAPVICQAFDCRGQFVRYSRRERRLLVAAKMLDPAILKAGRERLSTLKP